MDALQEITTRKLACRLQTHGSGGDWTCWLDGIYYESSGATIYEAMTRSFQKWKLDNEPQPRPSGLPERRICFVANNQGIGDTRHFFETDAPPEFVASLDRRNVFDRFSDKPDEFRQRLMRGGYSAIPSNDQSPCDEVIYGSHGNY